MRKLLCVLAIAMVFGPFAAVGAAFSYVDLIKRLTDMEHLAVLPETGEQCAQWSSYDRHSRYDAASGKYVDWDANGDGDGYIRKEGDQLVLAEMKGPGCIWRIWSAAPKDGHVRIYLDGDAEPAVDLPFIGYFDRKNEPFTRSALVHTVATGWDNYTPIPYQKSCKIVADANWGQYFHFDYDTLPAGTQVPTFKRQLSSDEAAALDQANIALENCGPFMRPATGEKVRVHELSLAGGAESTIRQATGPGAIKTIRLKLVPPVDQADRDTLREWTIQIRWDGESAPSVWAPLGDFFGTAAGANPYRSLPSGLTEDGWWYSHWFMPFAKGFELKLTNESQQERKVQLEIVTAPVHEEMAKLGRFHAKWHRDAFLPAEAERKIDWTMLKTKGGGRYCGVMLHVWNPRGGWWGEGDEKFFVDGEKFPSTIGTGSEDYFGYAWCNPTLFQNAYHDQTISMGNKGHVSVNRWQITDNIPFHSSFEGAIEKYYPNQRPTLYAARVYWYLSADGTDAYPPLPLGDRIGYWTEIVNPVVKGALEGERMKIPRYTGGNPHEQNLDGFAGTWSNSSHLWWTDAKPGDLLELALPVAESGHYRLTLQLTKARDYGIVQLYLDGQKLGDPIDLYDPEVVPSGPLAMGTHDLAAGEHRLGIAIVGANPAAVKSYMAGLDYVKLELAK
ncbi:MAG: DUF2961 domain-containing protein [Candidatus Omnitrophica bacterium]|nr:DUF2961 domain-containing protein [Candidatus Omnitrophota bacterium]